MKKAVVLVVILLSVCVQAQTLTVGLFQDPPSLDPAFATATSESNVLHQIFNTLLTFDEDGNFVPELATDWMISDDGLTYTLTLRDDVNFHDGTPFNAEAVKYSLERNMGMADGAFAEQLSVIEQINVIDDTNVEIVIAQPQGSFLTFLATISSMPVSPTAAAAGTDAFANNPIGTGAFQFVSRTLQDNITLARNENYWDGAPAIEEVVIRPFPDGSVRYANLLSGAVDMIYPIEPRDYVEAEDNDEVDTILQPTNGWRILVLDTTEPPFDDPDFRRALAATINRQAISQVVFNGLEPPATGPMPANSPYYTEPTNLQGVDLELAQELSGDSTFALTTIARSPEDQLTQLIQAMASQGDVELSIEPVEVGEYLRRNTSGEYDATTMQWSGQPDPDGNITSFFITDGFWNWSGYSNTEVDALLTQAQIETDVATRRDLYAQALEIINEDVPVIWLTNQVRLVATRPEVDGVFLLPNTGIMELENATISE